MANTSSVFETFIKSIAKLRREEDQRSEGDDKYEYGAVETYLTQDKVGTMDMSHYFFPLFFASEKGPLGIWEKQIGLGHIKRRIETDIGQRFHVLELVNTKQSLSTFIAAPKKEWMALHVSLPHLVIVMKNFRRNFSFEVQVLDNRGFLRRFDMATWFNPSSLKKWPFLCQLPLKLEIGWNEIHVDFNDLLKRTYNTRYFETVRIVINANCRLRQVFFCADKIISGELPIPSMRMFDNIRIVSPTFGSINHPNYTESGPNFCRDGALLDPTMIPPATRIEKDLRLIHIQRFNQLNKLQLREPYRSYFKDLLAKSQKVLDDMDGGVSDIDAARSRPSTTSSYQDRESDIEEGKLFPFPAGPDR